MLWFGRHDLQDSTREVLKSSTGDVKHLGDWRLGPDKVRQLEWLRVSTVLPRDRKQLGRHPHNTV